eukprot:m.261363 g.261363  ORF g.261363 m.261363 type:complete len:68 (+) comp15578_c0_seq7:96-299(+)
MYDTHKLCRCNGAVQMAQTRVGLVEIQEQQDMASKRAAALMVQLQQERDEYRKLTAQGLALTTHKDT